MLDRVSFTNFKSLQAVSIDLSPLTVLVGPNGSGKSSVLQGIHLLSQTSAPRNVDPAPGWARLEAIFTGPRHPRRLARRGTASMELAIREAGGDALRLILGFTPPGTSDHVDLKVKLDDLGGERSTLEGNNELRTTTDADGIHYRADPSCLSHNRVRHFSSAVYLHLDANLLSRTSTTDEELPRMAADGTGLASTLAWLAGAKPDTLAAIASDLAQIVPGVKRILIHRERIVDRVMEKVDIDGQPIWRPVDRPRIGDRFSIEFTNGTEVPADLLSEGTVIALGLLTKLREPDRPRLFLLDDIDRGLHIEAQARLVATLRELMQREPDLQIVCSTHSTYLLNLFKPEEVRVLALDSDRATHARPLTDHPEFATWKYGTQTGELWAALGDAWVVARDQA